MPDAANQRLIITHAVLTGLTPLIPVPIVDDLVKTYFQRRLVRALARNHSINLTEQDLRALADDPSGGCLKGCLGGALLLPFKLIFRKLFIFIEWKRAVDTVSHTYHRGYLIDYALRSGWFPNSCNAAEFRSAMDAVLKETGTGPLERAVSVTFSQSRATLKSAANLLSRSLKGISGEPDEQHVALVVEAVEPEEERQIEGVIARLQSAIQDIPSDYFDQLRARLASRLNIS